MEIKSIQLNPNGIEGCWRWSREKYRMESEAGNVEWVRTERGWEVYAKQYYKENASKPPQLFGHMKRLVIRMRQVKK